VPPAVVPGATLGGIMLSCAKGQSHGWALSSGVQPFVGEFLLSRPRAEAILARGARQLEGEGAQALKSVSRKSRRVLTGPLVFELKSPGYKTVKIAGLYATALKAGTDLNTWTLQAADRRWLWPMIHVERSYNVRRSTGQTRWNGEELVPLAAADVVPDFTHVRTSLISGLVAWTATQVLEDVLQELCGADGYVIEASVYASSQVTIQDLELSDPGPQALQRVLAHLPGVTVCPGEDGRIRAFSTLGSSEIEAARKAGPPVAGTGTWRIVDRSLVRPAKFRIFMPRELEIRFDLQQSDETFVEGKQPPWLENVVQVSDPTFKLADGREVVAGSWITVEEFFTALAANQNTGPTGSGANPATGLLLDEAAVRRFSLGGLSILQRFFSFHDGAFDQLWAGRIAAIGRDYRRAYRLSAQFADRIRSFRARRAVITDAENGQRAPSPVFCDYVLKPGLRTLSYRGSDKRGFQVSGWAADLANATPAPVSVRIVDQGAAIVRFEPRRDLFGVSADIQLGTAVAPPDASAASLAVLWAGAGQNEGLTDDFKLSTILSVTPASPNSEERLHSEEITIAEACAALGQETPAKNAGPVFEDKTGLESARFAWQDASKKQILASLTDGDDLPRSLLSNPLTVRDVAKAHAARIAATLLDRGEGSFRVSLNADVRPTGNLQTVQHGFSISGQGGTFFWTQLNMPPATASIPAESLLSESTRKKILRIVE